MCPRDNAMEYFKPACTNMGFKVQMLDYISFSKNQCISNIVPNPNVLHLHLK